MGSHLSLYVLAFPHQQFGFFGALNNNEGIKGHNNEHTQSQLPTHHEENDDISSNSQNIPE